MRSPSVKTLSQCFSNPVEAKRILKLSRSELAKLPAASARIAECYHHPKWYDVRMHALNAIEPGMHGLEAIETEAGEYADYLNTGDSYAPTLIFWRGNYRVQSVGDFVETMQRNGVRCK